MTRNTDEIVQELAPVLPLLRRVERGLYAALFMQSLIGHESYVVDFAHLYASEAVTFADALIEELDRTSPAEGDD